MSHRNPFVYSQSDANHLTAEERRNVDIVSGLAAIIFATTGKEFGFTDAEVARSRQASHDMLTKFLIEQRANPDQKR